MSDERTLFGISLRPEAARLLDEVEELYGVPVKEEIEDLGGNLGDTTVLQDGTPEIRIDSKSGRSEQNIVHELFHLKLRKEGFPELVFEFPPGTVIRDSERRWANWNNSIVREPLQHRLFYPLLRQMGLVPDEGLKVGFDDLVRKGEYSGVVPENAFAVHTGNYLRALLETDDQEFLDRLTDWFEKKGWHDSISAAEDLKEMIHQRDPRTPEEEINTLVEVLNRLYPNMARLAVKGWSEERRGDHTQRLVTIKISPPR